MNEILDIIILTHHGGSSNSTITTIHDKTLHMIELGCGTGIGQLALMSAIKAKTNSCRIHACFTDADPAVLNLCQRNCLLNHLPQDNYSIQELTWGQDHTKMTMNSNFDIVLATDVLYDIDMLHPLFATASQLLSSSSSSSKYQHRMFILSHIPRACYNDNNPPEATENLEKYIVDQGSKHYGLSLYQMIRPPISEKISSHVLEFCSKESFHGSAIFIFQKRT
jgi:hypothetical protein